MKIICKTLRSLPYQIFLSHTKLVPRDNLYLGIRVDRLQFDTRSWRFKIDVQRLYIPRFYALRLFSRNIYLEDT